MSDVRLVSVERTVRLSNEETVRVGRIIHSAVGRDTWFPDASPSAEVVVRDFDGQLPADARTKIEAVLGEFRETAEPV